jgi:hypothetical protein
MISRTIVIGAAALALAGCNPFHRSPAVEMSAADENLNTRWNGTFASPSSLAGVVQMSGSATMAPGGDRVTHVRVDLANATPGGEHPWGLHRGQCDYDEGLVGERSAYRPVKVGSDGRAHASANVDLHTPTSGRFAVRVMASAANANTIVACANLAPPSR